MTKGPSVFWHIDSVGSASAVLTYFFRCSMFTVIVLDYLQRAHCSIHCMVLRNNNKQTAKWIAAKCGETVTAGANHLGSSSNSRRASVRVSVSTRSPLLRCYLSPPSVSRPTRSTRGLSAQSVGSARVWAHACVHCDCELMAASGPCCVLSVWCRPHVAPLTAQHHLNIVHYTVNVSPNLLNTFVVFWTPVCWTEATSNTTATLSGACCLLRYVDHLHQFLFSLMSNDFFMSFPQLLRDHNPSPLRWHLCTSLFVL